MAHYQNQISSGGTATHLISGTRSSVLSARSAGTLIPGVSYEITDHVQGRLVAGTTVTILATSPTEVGQVATVNTTYDDQSWFGIYDIDLAQVIELHDGRNNIAITANAVSLFDWGNSAYTNCRIESSAFTVTYGATRPVNNFILRNGCTFVATGWSNGSINDVEIKNLGSLNLTNARVSFVRTLIDASTYNFSGYTANNTITKWDTIQSSINCSNSSVQIALSFINCTGLTINRSGFILGGSMLGSGLTVETSASITHLSGAGTCTITRTKLNTNSTISHQTGTTNITDTTLEGGCSITNSGPVSTVTLNQCNLEMGATIPSNRAVNISLSNSRMAQGATFQLSGGSTGSISASNTVMEQGSYIGFTAAASGLLSISSGLKLELNSYISKSGTAPTVSIAQMHLKNTSRLTLSGARRVVLNDVYGSDFAQITMGGTGTVTDNLQDVRVTARGQVNVLANGAQANTIRFSTVSGSSGVMNITGSSTGQVISRSHTVDGQISVLNNIVPMTHDFLVNNAGGNLVISNQSVDKTCSYIHVENGASFSLNGATLAGAVTRVKSSVNGRVQISGPTGTVTAVDCSEGIIVINGGAAHQNITKTMSSTLTTGNFTTSNIAHHDTTSKTLTANNTARANYLGVTSTLPLI